MKEKIKSIYVILIVILIVLGFAFYWFQWRPTQIRKKCYDVAINIGGVNFDKNYQSCLLDHGLEK